MPSKRTTKSTTTKLLQSEQKMRSNASRNNRKRRQKKSANCWEAEVGGWRPDDDLKLMLSIQQTNSIEDTWRAVKFSCSFSESDIRKRWHSLLYNKEVSDASKKAIQELHPSIVADIHLKAPFSEEEESLLKKIRSNSKPSLEVFQKLLAENSEIFLCSRSAKYVMSHWNLLHRFKLLEDQSGKSFRDDFHFSDNEEELMASINVTNNCKPESKQNIKMEVSLKQERLKLYRNNIAQVKRVENEIAKYQLVMDTIVSPNTDFEEGVMAILRGRIVKYLLLSREVTIGRCTSDLKVDIDLSIEGPSMKISRRQGVIHFIDKSFFITNTGKRPIYVNSVPLLKSSTTQLLNNYLLEVAGLKFVFLVNGDAIDKIRADSLKLLI
ncbi:microspherule protein 1-like protein [Leptotrombidium deliense]|uniref:Microspherule protein 1-like protein n=1 Tax=Leptotrombidium deliense TaxID=299467 RepID=A0A443SR18_9ACAR|nr:microspherule protein 1-like protein [Leptotrombidium deliense]